jgi:hypothetical protein
VLYEIALRVLVRTLSALNMVVRTNDTVESVEPVVLKGEFTREVLFYAVVYIAGPATYTSEVPDVIIAYDGSPITIHFAALEIDS